MRRSSSNRSRGIWKSSSGRLANLLEEANYLLHFGLLENAAYPLVIEVGERALLKAARVHRAALRQMFNDKVHKLDLVGVEVSA